MRPEELPWRAQNIVAQIMLDWQQRESLIEFADLLLDQGIYSYHLGELSASSSHLNLYELKLVYDQAVAELSLAPMTEPEAMRVLLETAIAEIAEAGVHDDYGYRIDNLLLKLGPAQPYDEQHEKWRMAMKEFGCVKMLQWQDTLRDEYFLNWYWDTVASVLAHNRSEASQFSRFWIRQQLCSRVDTAWSCWHDGTVVKLADHIQQQAEFGQLPILADALEEAGCTDRAILDHCRGNHPHSGYCWVADLFASKNEPRP